MEIKKIELIDTNNNKVIFESDKYDIGCYVRKRQWNNGPWKYVYEIIVGGKFDRSEVNKYKFGSKEWCEELERQKNSTDYIGSVMSLNDKLIENICGYTMSKHFIENISFVDIHNKQYTEKVEIFYDNSNGNGKLKSIEFTKDEKI